MPGLFFDSGIDKGFENDLRRMNEKYNSFSSEIATGNNLLIDSFKELAFTVAATFGVNEIVQFGKESVAMYIDSAKALAQVEQGIKSTGNAAGFTAEQFAKMAADYQKNTLFEDDTILKDVTAQLLTFTNIADDNFVRTQKAVLDLATRLDGDLKGAAIQVGKALNDPKQALSALSRSGIQFTEQQKELINTLVDTNRLADAQTIILNELEHQYGGSAEAAALAEGGITQLTNAIGDAREIFGQLVLEGIQPSINSLKDFFQNLSAQDIKDFFSTIKDGAEVIAILTAGFVAWKGSLQAISIIQKVNASLLDEGAKAESISLAQNLSDTEKKALGISNINRLTIEQANLIKDKIVVELEDLTLQKETLEIQLQNTALQSRAAKDQLVAVEQKIQAQTQAFSQAIAEKDLAAVRIAQQRAATLEDEKSVLLGTRKTATLEAQVISQKINNTELAITTTQTRLAAAADESAAVSKNVLTKASGGLARGFNSLKVAFAENPIGLLITALTLVIPLISEFTSELTDAQKAQQAIKDVEIEAQKSIAGQESRLQQLLSVAKDETRSLKDRQAAIKELNEISPKYLGGLDLQTIGTDKATRAVDAYSESILKNARIQAAQERLVEIEKELISLREEGTGAELKWYQAVFNNVLAGGNIAGTAAKNAESNIANFNDKQKELLTIRDALLKIATQQQIVDKKGGSTTPLGTGAGAKKEELSYYAQLKVALEDAKTALEQLSGPTELANMGQIQVQKDIISNVEAQISAQEELLGIKQKDKETTDQARLIEEGSLKFLEAKLAIAKENYEFATSDKARAAAKAEVDLTQKQIDALRGVNKEVQTRTDLNQLTLPVLIAIAREQKRQIELAEQLGNTTLGLKKSFHEISLEITNKIGQGVQDWANSLGQVGDAVSQIDSKTGQTISDVAKIGGSIGQTLVGIAQGPAGAATAIQGIASLVGNIFSIKKRKEARKEDERKQAIDKRTAEILERQNAALTDQEKLLESSKGADRYTQYASTLATILSQIQEIDNTSQNLVNFDELKKRREELTTEYDKLLEQSYKEFTNTTSDSITKSILDGFAGGKSAAADFADTFQELMRQSILQSFSVKFLESQFNQFYDSFAKAAESGGQLTATEIETLKQDFNAKINEASQGFTAFNDLFKSVFNTDLLKSDSNSTASTVDSVTSQAGQISQAITEDTGSALVGRLGAMVLSNQVLVDQSKDMLDYAIQNLVYMKAIQLNTDYLPRIEENTRRMYQKLDNI